MFKTRKISDLIKEKGVFYSIRMVLAYIKKNIFGVYRAIIFELDLKKPVPKINTNLKISYRFATKKDIDSMDEKQFNLDFKSKLYAKERLANGNKCILALHNKKIIGHLWYMKDYMDLSLKKKILLSKNRAYTYNGFVIKEYRGKRIHAAMYAYIVNLLRKEGKRFVISAVDMDNRIALKTKLKNRADYEKIGKLYHIRFLGLKYDFIQKRELTYLQKN